MAAAAAAAAAAEEQEEDEDEDEDEEQEVEDRSCRRQLQKMPKQYGGPGRPILQRINTTNAK